MDTFSVTIISRWPIVRERVKVGMYGYHFTSNQIGLKITLRFHLPSIFRVEFVFLCLGHVSISDFTMLTEGCRVLIPSKLSSVDLIRLYSI